MAGIYIHIPFCKQACFYCDFHFSTSQELRPKLVDSICIELKERRAYLSEPVETIYFGGGTPSLLNAKELHKIIDHVYRFYQVNEEVEVTLEANPDDLTRKKLDELKSCGVNRLSIGIQTFSDELLKVLNRAHNSQQAAVALENAHKVGFENLNVDLIYSIPGETLKALEHDLDTFVKSDPEHISCYALTIEEKTVFGKWSKSGKFKPVDDETDAQHFELVMDKLTGAGYDQYEISNFSKPGFHSRHNSSYWLGKPYLGVGPSSHSYNGHTRRFNVSNNSVYIRALDAGGVYFEEEVLTTENKINEFLLTSLRTKWGCDTQILKRNFGYNLKMDQKAYLTKLDQDGYIHNDGDIIQLTRKGKFLADQILSELVLVKTNQT